MFLRLPLTLASPAGRRARLSILIFHRVLAKPDPLFPETPDAQAFSTQMRWVASLFNVLPLGEAIDRLYQHTLPSRALCITFDDGYADNESVAAPILQQLGLPATVFVTTDFVDGGCMWNDRVIEAIRACQTDSIDLSNAGLGRLDVASPLTRRQAIDRLLGQIKHMEPTQRRAATDAVVAACGAHPSPYLMMPAEQLRRLRQRDIEIGAHTSTHPILTKISSSVARDEIVRSKARLQDLLDERITLFAYPNGVPEQDYSAEHVEMVRAAGYSAAVTTAWGAATSRSDRFQLPRFTPWDRSRLAFGARLLGNLRRTEHKVVSSPGQFADAVDMSQPT